MRIICRLLTLLAICFTCFPFTPEEVALKAEGKIRSLKSLQAHFDQIYYSVSINSPLKEEGKFYFKKPDMMRWEYTKPEEKIFLYKEGIFLSYFPDDKQLFRNSFLEDDYESEIFALLSGQKGLEINYDVEFNPFPSENTQDWQLKLTPKKEGEYSYILLEINKNNWLIQKAIFFDWTGNKTEFHFSQVKTDVKLSPALFELKVPPDCEIIDARRQEEEKSSKDERKSSP